MSLHKRLLGSFAHHQHLNRAAAVTPDEDEDEDETPTQKHKAEVEAARESKAAAAASKSAAAAAVAAASESAQQKAAADAQTATLPGQGLPVPHGFTPVLTPAGEPTPSVAVPSSATPVLQSNPTSVPKAISTTTTTSPSSTAINVNQASSTSPDVKTSSQGLSKGAIGGIVAVVILLLVVVSAFVVRKLRMRRRAMKRNTWGAGLVPALESKRTTVYTNDSTMTSEPKLFAMSQTATTPLTPVSLPLPPSLSYSPSAPASISPLVPPTAAVSSANAAIPSSPDAAVEFAVVVRTFVPTLPDELQISNGEHIRVLSSFDDGWALCANIRGEQGVVPLECLHRDTGLSAQMQLQPESEFGYDANKAARRLSSLVPGTGATY